MRPTVEPGVVIESSCPGVTVYQDLTTGARWRIDGVCTCCGLCEVGAVNLYLEWRGLPGTPGACVDRRGMTRPDVPIRPELPVKLPGCVLTGEYL